MERKQDILDELIFISGNVEVKENYNKELLYKLKESNRPSISEYKTNWISNRSLGASFLVSGIIIMIFNNLNMEVISALNNSKDMIFNFIYNIWK